MSIPGGMVGWGVPNGLPPGRFIRPGPGVAREEPVLWVSDEPTPDAVRLWIRLVNEHARSGLWPLLLRGLQPPPAMAGRVPAAWLAKNMGRPWHTGELDPVPPENVDGIDAGDVLARWWTERESDLSGGDSALPLGAWLGPASPGATVDTVDALQHAVAVASSAAGPKLLTGREDGVFLGLVPARDGAAALATCGWIPPNGDIAENAAVLRSWQERFGARLCTLGMDRLILTVAAPPTTTTHSQRVAAEHFAYCEEMEADDFHDYAAELRNSPVWHFWWD